MIIDVKLYEKQYAVDYYELDELGEPNDALGSNLVYTDDVEYMVEWGEKTDGCTMMKNKRYTSLEEALAFYKDMKAREDK